MNLRPFGRTGLQVSPLCLSTTHFSWRIGSRDSSTILNRFCDSGGNFVQTHSIWGRELDLGTLSASPSEEHVGLRLLREPWAPASFARSTPAATLDPKPGEPDNLHTLMTAELGVLQP